tara:strand:+ start:554 stop:1489 length:936 start_codon:yes stop_codon:yes gene_type:complete
MGFKTKVKSLINKGKNFATSKYFSLKKKRLLKKIKLAELNYEPFPFLIIYNFFDPEEFKKITLSESIIVEGNSDEELIDNLSSKGWDPIKFPGCTENKSDYLNFRKTGQLGNITPEMCEGFGMAVRLNKKRNKFLEEYINFFNSSDFIDAIANKFNIERYENETIDSGLQKYLDGYEISPHPDIRKKLLTFMINVNTNSCSEDCIHHTHLLDLKQRYLNINNYWDQNPLSDRAWLPWDWCNTKFIHKQNNSLIAFPPCNLSLHAVKANYDHLKHQRTQFYGNLWLTENPCNSMPDHKALKKLCLITENCSP